MKIDASLPFSQIQFPYPFKHDVDQTVGKEIMKQHFFQGKQLPHTPLAEYPRGLTKQAVLQKWLEKGPEGEITLRVVPYSAMLIRGMYYNFILEV